MYEKLFQISYERNEKPNVTIITADYNFVEPHSHKDDINYKFAYYIMRSPSFQHRVIKEGTSSQATLPIINKGKWEQLSIHFPEINEQEIIASHLDSLSSKVLDLQANFDKISQECDALKQAILRQVFE